MPMPEHHAILGGRVHVYKRGKGTRFSQGIVGSIPATRVPLAEIFQNGVSGEPTLCGA
jgi:hypothetical protein